MTDLYQKRDHWSFSRIEYRANGGEALRTILYLKNVILELRN